MNTMVLNAFIEFVVINHTKYFRNVFRDLNLARNTFENDKELAWITDAFKLSEYALSHDPYQLAPHMIDRLSKEKVSVHTL